MGASAASNTPTLLFAVPDALFVPRVRHGVKEFVCNQTGGSYEYLAYLASDLFHAGVDVHVVQPYFRRLMATERAHPAESVCANLPNARVHLARDRSFYYADVPEANPDWLNLRIAVAFQREVLYRWIPEIGPDLILCYDWMCGLIPAAACGMKLPSVFTLHRTQTQWVPLGVVEDIGLDAASFWDRLYYRYLPGDYFQAHQVNAMNLLLSGVNAATLTNVVGAGALNELATSMSGNTATPLRQMLLTGIRMQRITTICEKSFSTDDYVGLCERVLDRSLTFAGDRQPAVGRPRARVRSMAGPAAGRSKILAAGGSGRRLFCAPVLAAS